VIAYVGYTGNASRNAPHLHFAVSPDGGPAQVVRRRRARSLYKLVIAAAPHPESGQTVVAADVKPWRPECDGASRRRQSHYFRPIARLLTVAFVRVWGSL